MTILSIGRPITETAMMALAPDPTTFSKGRDFAAWVGLTPLQTSTGGKQKLGATSKMGERILRRLLIIGASKEQLPHQTSKPITISLCKCRTVTHSLSRKAMELDKVEAI